MFLPMKQAGKIEFAQGTRQRHWPFLCLQASAASLTAAKMSAQADDREHCRVAHRISGVRLRCWDCRTLEVWSSHGVFAQPIACQALARPEVRVARRAHADRWDYQCKSTDDLPDGKVGYPAFRWQVSLEPPTPALAGE